MRVKELEALLEEVRTLHSKKVRALEAQLREGPTTAARAAAPPRARSAGTGAPRSNTAQPAKARTGVQQEHRQALESQVALKEQRVERLEAEVAALRKRLAAADKQVSVAAEREQAAAFAMQRQREEVQELLAAKAGLTEQLAELPALRQQAAQALELHSRLAEVQGQLREAEAALAATRHECEEGAARGAALRAQHQADLDRRQQQHQRELLEAHGAQAAELQARLIAAERQAWESERQVGEMQAQLRDARQHIPWMPSAAEFAGLERRLGEAQQQQLAREAQWLRAAEDSRQAAAAREAAIHERYEAALGIEHRQLGAFRQDLDGLLVAARALQEAGRG